MTITTLTYSDLADLDADRLVALEEVAAAVLAENDPDVDLRRGAVKDLLLHPRALLMAQNEQAVLGALNSGSLAALVADPTLATDEGAVDRVLGNYGLTRRAAAVATGQVTLVLDTLTPAVIPSGSVFTLNGLSFVADRTYAARTSSLQVTGAGDRLLTLTGANDYAFTIGVVASLAGSTGNVRRGTTATPASAPVSFLTAYAATDFTGGADAETNTQLLARQQAGLAVKAWSNRAGIEAVIRAATVDVVTTNSDGTTTTTQALQFPTLDVISVIGMGDAEMLRDKHSLFPVAGGGRADLYAKTDRTYQTVTVRKTASLISKVGSVGTWQFGLGRADAPGYYEVTGVLLTTQDASSAGFPLATEVRSIDLSGTGWKPDVTVVAEGVYSYYQAATCSFVDTVTDATSLLVGATKDYDVVVRLMPQLAELQLLWNDVSRRPTMGDVLAKAPIPCFTSVSFTLNVRRGSSVTTSVVQSAVADVVNSLGFAGSLPASLLAQTLHTLLGDALVSVSGMQLTGRLRRPSGTVSFPSSPTLLTLPEESTEMLSGRTAVFLTDPNSVSVTVATVDAPGV